MIYSASSSRLTRSRFTASLPIACLLLIGLLPCPGLQSADTEVLKFGVYTADKPSSMYRQFKPILNSLEKHITADLGRKVKVKLKILKSYDDAIDALVEGSIDFVRFGPAPYCIAKARNPDVELLAIEEKKGKRRFNGIICVRKDSQLKTLEDLAGKSFAFGDSNSTIGRYLSQSLLVESGIWSRSLARFDYLDRHDKVVTAVLHGKFDAGAAKEGTFKKYAKKGLRVLAKFDNVTKPWVARAGLRPDTLASLRAALLATTDKAVLRPISKSLTNFGKVEDSEYDFVRRGMEKAKEFLTGPKPLNPAVLGGRAPEQPVREESEEDSEPDPSRNSAAKPSANRARAEGR